MPTYEYKCDECGIAFECFQHFSEDPLECCPECNGHVHRVVFPVGIIFKGSGFYVTDSRGKSSSSLASTPKASEKSLSEGESSQSAESASNSGKSPSSET